MPGGKQDPRVPPVAICIVRVRRRDAGGVVVDVTATHDVARWRSSTQSSEHGSPEDALEQVARFLSNYA